MTKLADVLERSGTEGLSYAACRQELTDDDARWLAEHGDDGVLYQLWYRGIVLKNVDGKVFRELVANSLPSIRALAARSSGLTIAMMAELSRDVSPLVRLDLAKNPETLASFLKVLSEDTDVRVAKAASASLAAQEAEAAETEKAIAEEDAGGPPDGTESPDDASGETESQESPGLLRRFIAKLGRK